MENFATLIILISFMAFTAWFMMGGPVIKVKKVKVDLSKLSDKELREKVSYGKYFVVNAAMAVQRMGKEFTSLYEFWKEKLQTNEVDLKDMFILSLIIKKEDSEMDELLARCHYCNENLNKVEDYLKTHTYNEAILEFIDPKISYYLINILQTMKKNFENKTELLPDGTSKEIGDKLDKFFESVVPAIEDNKNACVSQ